MTMMIGGLASLAIIFVHICFFCGEILNLRQPSYFYENFQMEEGFVMLRSAFKKAGIDDEQMKCILHINYHYFLLSYTFSSSMPVVFWENSCL